MSIKKKEKRKLLKKSVSLALLIFIFSVISFYTSYTGLLKLSGAEEESLILKIFMGILIGGLQFALVFSINNLYFKDFFEENWTKAIALLLVYFITMALSVTFSFSYWYEEFSAESYAKRSSELQLNRVKRSLINAQKSFQMVENSLLKLSSYSHVKSDMEKNYGRTCNPRVGAGEGSYTWIRADDATFTKKYSIDIQVLKRELNSEISNVSKYLERFDPKGNVVSFNREVNDKINYINNNFFNSNIIENLKDMLTIRSGSNRKNISVRNRRTGNIYNKSCIDEEFTLGAKKVIKKIDSLKPIQFLTFFDASDTKRLFARTVSVLKAVVTPSHEIKKVDEISNPDDITYDDISAVSAGFVIDLLILLIALYGKESKYEPVILQMAEDILNGKHSSIFLQTIKPFIAETSNYYLLAIPNISEDDEAIKNIKLLILYMEKYGFIELYVNKAKPNKVNKYFEEELITIYPNSDFNVYKMDKKRFNSFILQNIKEEV